MKQNQTDFDLFIREIIKNASSPGVVVIMAFFSGTIFGLFLGSFLRFMNW